MIDTNDFPTFRPHPLLAGGHAQTLAGAYLPGGKYPYRARQHLLTLPDGDRLVLHDDRPAGWHGGHRVALLIHGLAGCHQSSYMRRVAGKLNQLGVRTFRMDLRGSGAGFGLARNPYHAGRSEDAAAAIQYLASGCAGSPCTLIGFSLGANITLKLLGELAGASCGHLDSAVAVCPPADLAVCARQLRRPGNRMYDRHFTSLLVRQVRQLRGILREARTIDPKRPPRNLYEFDDTFTAVACGFGTADNYYGQSSSLPLIRHIHLPTLIIAADDDPLVPCEQFDDIELPPAVRLIITAGGGHLGFIGRRGGDADRRWMDWRVVDWVRGFDVVGESNIQRGDGLKTA